jgi:hypothetical protein
VSYIVHVNAAGVATPYVNVKDAALQSTTIEFDGSAGTIYFNYFTDEQSYVYVKEAVVTYMTYDLETLAGDVAENSMRISNLEAGGGSSSTSYSNAIGHHCVNRPYDFKDKTALYFGDSITNGWTSGKKADNGGFPTLFSNMVGLTFTNYGKNSVFMNHAEKVLCLFDENLDPRLYFLDKTLKEISIPQETFLDICENSKDLNAIQSMFAINRDMTGFIVIPGNMNSSRNNTYGYISKGLEIAIKNNYYLNYNPVGSYTGFATGEVNKNGYVEVSLALADKVNVTIVTDVDVADNEIIFEGLI